MPAAPPQLIPRIADPAVAVDGRIQPMPNFLYRRMQRLGGPGLAWWFWLTSRTFRKCWRTARPVLRKRLFLRGGRKVVDFTFVAVEEFERRYGETKDDDKRAPSSQSDSKVAELEGIAGDMAACVVDDDAILRAARRHGGLFEIHLVSRAAKTDPWQVMYRPAQIYAHPEAGEAFGPMPFWVWGCWGPPPPKTIGQRIWDAIVGEDSGYGYPEL